MPSVSNKQHNAMEAAAHGHSTLGIPQSVGRDFVEADMHHPHQQHSQHHHAMTKPEVNPGRKDHVAIQRGAGSDIHHIVDGVPHHKHKHHVHDRRDKGMEHHHHPHPHGE